MTTKFTSSVLADVEAERAHQRQLWGDDHDDQHSTLDFLLYIDEYHHKALDVLDGDRDPIALRKRLIQIAALAVAAAEVIDRKVELD